MFACEKQNSAEKKFLSHYFVVSKNVILFPPNLFTMLKSAGRFIFILFIMKVVYNKVCMLPHDLGSPVKVVKGRKSEGLNMNNPVCSDSGMRGKTNLLRHNPIGLNVYLNSSL